MSKDTVIILVSLQQQVQTNQNMYYTVRFNPLHRTEIASSKHSSLLYILFYSSLSSLFMCLPTVLSTFLFSFLSSLLFSLLSSLCCTFLSCFLACIQCLVDLIKWQSINFLDHKNLKTICAADQLYQ